jgi:hypothetical protein
MEQHNYILSLSLSLSPFSRLGMAAALDDNHISLSQNYSTTMEGIKDGINLSERSTKHVYNLEMKN